MALSYGPNLGVLVNGAQGEEHYEALMKTWRILDAIVQGRVISASLTAPPGAPSDGDCYIVAAGATGEWSGKATQIARWSTVKTEWEFAVPRDGWTIWLSSTNEQMRFIGTGWLVAYSQSVPLLEYAANDITKTMANADAGLMIRFTGTGAKSAPFSATQNFVRGKVFHLSNRAVSGNLTLQGTNGMTLNPPKGGTLVLEPGDTVSVHIISSNVADVFGSTSNA